MRAPVSRFTPESPEKARLNKNTYKILGLELTKVKRIRSISFIQGTFVNTLRQVILFVLMWLIFGRVMDEFQKAKTPVIACCAASLKVGDKVAADKLTHVFQLSPTAADIANSVTAAVAASGFPAEAFHFYGDFTTHAGPLQRRLIPILRHAESTILFCTTESCSAILNVIAKLAPRREVALACDLTLEQETILRGTARRVAEGLKRIRTPQHITMVVAGKKPLLRKAGTRAKTSQSLHA